MLARFLEIGKFRKPAILAELCRVSFKFFKIFPRISGNFIQQNKFIR